MSKQEPELSFAVEWPEDKAIAEATGLPVRPPTPRRLLLGKA
jgi:hypothetical protein